MAVRSGKHSSSTAYHHLQDMKRIRRLPEFESSFFIDGVVGQSKPMMIITVDGGPDENPRYEKTIISAVDYFCTYDLDALFICTNAPGRSAFNRAERRMVKFSKDLSGVLLPHDHFGTHLNSQGKTINTDLERKNFAHAGKLLAEIWSDTVIDGHPTVSEFIDGEPDIETLTKKSASWKATHLRESQYCLQIVKCKNEACCTPFRSSIRTV